jgi:hypothetical protein
MLFMNVSVLFQQTSIITAAYYSRVNVFALNFLRICTFIEELIFDVWGFSISDMYIFR